MTRKYTVAVGQKGAPAGTAVYACAYHDYGCADDDTASTGVHHISVSLTEDGNYPFFTIPRRNLREEVFAPLPAAAKPPSGLKNLQALSTPKPTKRKR